MRVFKLSQLFTFKNLISTRYYCSTRKPAYYHRVGSYPLTYTTLGQQFEIAAEKYHDREAFVACYENKRLTYSEVLNQADILAAKFLQLGLKPGDHIGLWAPNTIQWVITFIAAARANLVVACLNPALQANEIKYSLKKAKCKAVIAQDEHKHYKYYDILKHSVPELENHDISKGDIVSESLPDLKKVFLDTDTDISGVYKFKNLFNDAVFSHFYIEFIKGLQKTGEPDNAAIIQFTSGTTGKPKGAVLSSFNFVNSSLIFGQRTWLDKTHYEHRLLLQAPLFHAFGLTIICANIFYGSTLVLPYPTFNAEECLKMVEKEKCTTILGSPTMLIDALAAQSKHNFNVSSLKLAVAGGSTCTPQVYKDVKEVFGLEHFNIVYGLSEATAADFASFGYESESLLERTVGKIYDHLEAKVINDEGKTVNFGQSGELCMRGFAIFKGYFEEEEKTKEVLGSDQWLKTGDQFVLYETGYGTVVGRKKDIIIRGGENIFPKEIEDYLETHPDILESQVIGVPDQRMGEEVCAFLRMKHDRTPLTLEDVKTFCKGNIAHFKIPKYVKIIDEFPKTTSGKIKKFVLKDMAKELVK